MHTLSQSNPCAVPGSPLACEQGEGKESGDSRSGESPEKEDNVFPLFI